MASARCAVQTRLRTNRLCDGAGRSYGCVYGVLQLGASVRSIIERFWARVDAATPDKCWIWKGAKTAAGYGTIMSEPRRRSAENRTLLAHRVSYMIHHGNPGRLFVCHRCDNPPCVNPNHLFAGTQSDNMRDCRKKERTIDFTSPGKRRRGDEHWKAKLTTADVISIREARRTGTPISVLGNIHGVDKSTIARVSRGDSWGHVQDEVGRPTDCAPSATESSQIKPHSRGESSRKG